MNYLTIHQKSDTSGQRFAIASVESQAKGLTEIAKGKATSICNHS
ncbi:MAG: hypothetical protein ACK5RT_09050 [Dolichospermum sp.]